jgi:murein DD-endopeptidase MepM/ murein hydrolase activator NlpD
LSDRTLKVDSPMMVGNDVSSWQEFLRDAFRSRWSIEYPIDVDGVYGVATRAATASFMRAWGVEDTGEALKDGLTPGWRSKLRNNDRTDEEKVRALSDEIKAYRRRLEARFERLLVCYPVNNLITDDNGWTGPNGHDGVDLITAWRGPLLAICDGIIRRVDSSGWWGNNPQPSPGHPISDGDGIIVLKCTITAGPFRPGLHFGYGHAEDATVREGDRVRAGQTIGLVGWARAPHCHFMCNDDPPVNGLYRGVGDRDPMPFLDFSSGK